jgi:hypothetical protein
MKRQTQSARRKTEYQLPPDAERTYPFVWACENRLLISRAQGYKLVARGELHTYMVGRRRYMTEAACREFIARAEKKAR